MQSILHTNSIALVRAALLRTLTNGAMPMATGVQSTRTHYRMACADPKKIFAWRISSPDPVDCSQGTFGICLKNRQPLAYWKRILFPANVLGNWNHSAIVVLAARRGNDSSPCFTSAGCL
jgi:hypothetical protein